MLWKLLLKGRIAGLLPALLLVLSISSALGALLGGWKGALIAPLVTLLTGAVTLHVTLCWLLRRGKRAQARGDHWRAWRSLWFLQLPFMGRYDRDGRGRKAFSAASKAVAGGVLRNTVGRLFKPHHANA